MALYETVFVGRQNPILQELTTLDPVTGAVAPLDLTAVTHLYFEVYTRDPSVPRFRFDFKGTDAALFAYPSTAGTAAGTNGQIQFTPAGSTFQFQDRGLWRARFVPTTTNQPSGIVWPEFALNIKP